jgi:hypothetical protein
MRTKYACATIQSALIAMLSLAAYALEPRKQFIYVSDDDKWKKALYNDNQSLVNWLTRAAFVWLDVYLVASAVIGYHDMKDFIEFQKWLIMVLLFFGTVSVIMLAILLCFSPDHLKGGDDDEEEEEDEEQEVVEGEAVPVKNEVVEEFANYVEEEEDEEGVEGDEQPFLETADADADADAEAEAEGETSPSLGLRYRGRGWSL